MRWRYKASGAVKGALALKDGKLFFGDYGGKVQAIRQADGHRLWRSNAAGSALGLRAGRFYSTPAVAYGRVYIGSLDGFVYSFAASNGAPRVAPQDRRLRLLLARGGVGRGAGPTVYIGSYDGKLYALNARIGAVRWTRTPAGKISGGPVVVGDLVFYSNLTRRSTAAVGARTGELVWKTDRGAFNPAISDGRRIYLVGYSSMFMLADRDQARRDARVRLRDPVERRRARNRARARAEAVAPAVVGRRVARRRRATARRVAARKRAVARNRRLRREHGDLLPLRRPHGLRVPRKLVASRARPTTARSAGRASRAGGCVPLGRPGTAHASGLPGEGKQEPAPAAPNRTHGARRKGHLTRRATRRTAIPGRRQVRLRLGRPGSGRSGRSTRTAPRRRPRAARPPVVELARAARGDHRAPPTASDDRPRQRDVVAVVRPVAVHAREQDLAGPALDALARPRDRVAARRRAAAGDEHLPRRLAVRRPAWRRSPAPRTARRTAPPARRRAPGGRPPRSSR